MNHNVKIMALKALDENGSGSDTAAGLCEKKESADAAGESIASQVSGDD